MWWRYCNTVIDTQAQLYIQQAIQCVSLPMNNSSPRPFKRIPCSHRHPQLPRYPELKAC
jgi:hypothetical protein